MEYLENTTGQMHRGEGCILRKATVECLLKRPSPGALVMNKRGFHAHRGCFTSSVPIAVDWGICLPHPLYPVIGPPVTGIPLVRR